MLEVCPAVATETPKIEIHPLVIGGREDPVRLVFTAAPGEGFTVGMGAPFAGEFAFIDESTTTARRRAGQTWTP